MHWKEKLAESVGFAPAVGAVLAIVAGFTLPLLDRELGIGRDTWFMFGGGPDGARELLSTITASMITFTALVFSITVLVLQLAGNQYSPRVIGSFLRERSTKWALAVFVGTFVFSTVVLTKIRNGPNEFVPGSSVWLAFVLVLASTAVFVGYIERMTQSVRAITIIVRVADETRRVMSRLYPESGEDALQRDFEPDAAEPGQILRNERTPGVLAALDGDILLDLASNAGVTLELVPKLGDFLPCGAELVRVWGQGEVDERLIRRALSIESERSIEQDPAFGFRQLVDIAVRALSPGINDPTTAVQALDHLHDLVRRLTTCCLPARGRADAKGVLRVVVRTPSYEDFVRLAFEEISRCARISIQVRRRLLIAFEDCISVAGPARRAVLQQELARADLG